MKSEATAVKYVQAFERQAADSPLFGRLYSRLFYRGMISSECSLACIEPGDRVVQIGCGPFPMTAIELARRGCDVTAVDRDERALTRAERVAARMEAAGGSEAEAASRIRFVCRDARAFDYGGFRAVIIALHVQPKDAVLARIAATSDSATRVVYRNPRSLLRAAYQTVSPSDGGCPECTQCRAVSFGKALVMFETGVMAWTGKRAVVRPMTSEASGCDSCTIDCSPCTLCELSPRQCVRIAVAPHIPSLAALGVRPGKECRFVASQPFGGPVICSVDGRQVAIERDVARRIQVERDHSESIRPAVPV